LASIGSTGGAIEYSEVGSVGIISNQRLTTKPADGDPGTWAR
jgi:hypothetical protein